MPAPQRVRTSVNLLRRETLTGLAYICPPLYSDRDKRLERTPIWLYVLYFV